MAREYQVIAKITKTVTRATEFIAAMILAVIFITFLLQIFTRYAPKLAWLVPINFIAEWMMTLQPIGWTINLISLLWVWLIFFSCAFFVKDKDHVAFDVLFFAAPAFGQKIMLLLGSFCMIAIMLYSFGPTWDFVFGSRLMELKKIQTLRIPITGDKIAVKWLFASYILLMIAVIAHHIWRILCLLQLVPKQFYSHDSTHDKMPLPSGKSGDGK